MGKNNQNNEITADSLKGVPGSMKLNAEEREECARLSMMPSEFIRLRHRGLLPSQTTQESQSQEIAVSSGSKDLLTLVGENSALMVENRMLKEQLDKEGSQGLSGTEIVEGALTKMKLDDALEKVGRLKSKLDKLEKSLEEKTETLDGIDKSEKMFNMAKEGIVAIIDTVGERFPDAAEGLINRISPAKKDETLTATIELSEEEKLTMEIGKSLQDGFKGERFNTISAIMGVIIDHPEQLEKVAKFLKDQKLKSN